MSNSSVNNAIGVSSVAGLTGFGGADSASSVSTGSLLTDSLNYNTPLHQIFLQAQTDANKLQPLIQPTSTLSSQAAVDAQNVINAQAQKAQQQNVILEEQRQKIINSFGDNMQNFPTSTARQLGYVDGPSIYAAIFGPNSSSDSSSSSSSSSTNNTTNQPTQQNTGTQVPQNLNAGPGLQAILGG